MTTITDTMRTVAGDPDNTEVVFFVPEVRPAASGTATVTVKRVPVTPVNGAFSVTLDPGLVYAQFGSGRHPFVVPTSGTARMGTLIAQYLPPTTTPTQAAAAIAAYLAENPIEGGGGGLTEEQIATAATTPGAPIQTALAQSFAPVDDPNLVTWRRKIAERGTRPVRVVSLGDSWAAPVGATTPDKGWYSLVADILGAGSSGRHISPRAPQSVNLAGNATFDDNANPHMVILATTGVSSFFDLGSYDTVDVFYMRVGSAESPSVGRPQFSIDGGAYSDGYASDIDLFSPGSSYRLGRIANFKGATLRLKPHATAASGSYIFGIIARRGAIGTGVEWINWGVSGWTAARWMQVATNWQMAEPLKSLPADLLHINLGANDALQGLSVASMVNELRNLVNLYRGQVAASCALLFTLMPYPDASIPDAEWDTRMDAIAALAVEFGGFVSDWRKQIGRQTQIGALVIAPNDFHLNDAGHRYVADVVGRLLAPPVAAAPGLSKTVADATYAPVDDPRFDAVGGGTPVTIETDPDGATVLVIGA